VGVERDFISRSVGYNIPNQRISDPLGHRIAVGVASIGTHTKPNLDFPDDSAFTSADEVRRERRFRRNFDL